MPTRQPDWEFIANLGDASPLDYGGYFIYRDRTGVYQEEAELIVPNEEEGETYTVYRFGLDRLKKVNGFLVPIRYERDWPQPVEAYDTWFHEDLGAVASFIDSTKEQLEAAFTSPDPRARAFAYQAVGEYHGMENLDSYPLTLTRKEVEKRYQRKRKDLITTTMVREGFRQVTQEEFFATVGKMDVTPYPQGQWSKEFGYLSLWKSRHGAVEGMSDEGGGGVPGASAIRRYWIKSP